MSFVSMDERDKKFIQDQRRFLLKNPVIRRKRYILPTTDQQLIETNIRLREEGINSIRHFLVGMMLLLVDDDPDVLKAIETLKERYKIKYRKNALISASSKKKQKIEERIFDLTDEELEELYSVVEIDQEF